MPTNTLRLAAGFALAVLGLAPGTPAAAQGTGRGAAAAPRPPAARRPLRAADVYRVRDVADPRRSPDGRWVAYAVTAADSARDKNNSDLWMTSWDGAQTVQLTSSPDGENTPRWSPDGRYLAFLSSRDDSSETTQLWLLNRQGGEGVRATQLPGDVQQYAWSPDGTRIVLVAEDGPDEMTADSTQKDTTAARRGGKSKTPKPIVVDRYRYKRDVAGYLGKRRTHLYLFDVAARTARILTPGTYDEDAPAWSPDGTRLAFVSKRAPADPDRADNWDVFVMDARPGAAPRQLTTSVGQDNPPRGSALAWSPDGQSIAYVRGSADPRLYAYDQHELAVVPVGGGEPRVLTAQLDRPVSEPHWSADGRAITVLVEDDRSVYPARVDARGGRVTRLVPGKLVASDLSLGRDGALTALVATDTQPGEVYAVERGKLRQLSHQNDGWLAEVQLGTTEEFASRSKDGTEVHGLLVKPAGFTAGRRAPTLLRIHGGPNGQDQHAFSFERELLAANGYLVVAANYRGSAGRGAAFQQAIRGDWGNKEVVDLLGAMDHVVAAGLADPDKLGIGGWSYGGILTNYTIATDGRFKAATSGAGSSLQLSMYGVDQYITQYAAEIGHPWENPDLWMKLSYPFFHADRIKTPTLFLGGEKDFNVPIAGSEQMYQALRALDVPTQLVIYPGQFHGITRPSFKVDRLERYLAWYGKYLKPQATAAAGAGAQGGAAR
jgi:dipeptidyl aminopeptidase/acylaminoacyl peptidase